MTNTLNISRIAQFVAAFALLTMLVAALPASAQQIQEQCTLSRNVKFSLVGADVVLDKDKVVGSTDAATTATKNGGTALSAAEKTELVKKWGTVCLINTVNTVTDWAFFIILTISFVFVAFGGFTWMTSQGDPEKQDKAGKMIAAALVGTIIAIIARVIPAIITGVLT